MTKIISKRDNVIDIFRNQKSKKKETAQTFDRKTNNNKRLEFPKNEGLDEKTFKATIAKQKIQETIYFTGALTIIAPLIAYSPVVAASIVLLGTFAKKIYDFTKNYKGVITTPKKMMTSALACGVTAIGIGMPAALIAHKLSSNVQQTAIYSENLNKALTSQFNAHTHDCKEGYIGFDYIKTASDEGFILTKEQKCKDQNNIQITKP